jgi:hypothetical protein
MSPGIIALIIVVIVAVLIVGFVFARPQLQRQRLRMRYGPEYDHVVRERGGHNEAVRELLARERRHKELNLRPLDPARRDHFQTEWLTVQERFVDTPGGAAQEADRLITSIMTDQGYPDEGYEQRVADLSVEHARATDRYRKAHDIAARSTGDAATTEDLRQALVHYRALFEELLGVREGTLDTTTSGRGRHASTKDEERAAAAEDHAATKDEERAAVEEDRAATKDEERAAAAEDHAATKDEERAAVEEDRAAPADDEPRTATRPRRRARDERVDPAEAPADDESAGRKR